MFVVHHGPKGRIIIHRDGCPLLEDRYYDGGWQHRACCFVDAQDRAKEMIEPLDTAHEVCGWCKPNAPH